MITIIIKEGIKYDGLSAFISFKYDKYIIDILRSMRIRFYHVDTKNWELPKAKLNDFLSRDIGEYKIIDNTTKKEIVSKDINKTSDKKEFVIPNNITIPKNYKFKQKPLQHQTEGIRFGLYKNSILLADQMGLGKTYQSIHIASLRKKLNDVNKCLIVVGVKGLMWTWKNEIATHTNTNGYILGTRINKQGKSIVGSLKDRLEDLENIKKIKSYFLITNIESIRNKDFHKALLQCLENKSINMIILDEATCIKNTTSIQTKHFIQYHKVDYKIALTGTPLMNSILDLYPIMYWLGYEKHNFYTYKNYYCQMGGYGNYQVIGYKHLDGLQEHLDTFTLRRLKENVLDLPSKTYIDEYVIMNDKQYIIYKEVQNELQRNIDKILLNPNPLSALTRLRQATGYTGLLSKKICESAKLERLLELAKELKDNKRKFIVFSAFSTMIEVIATLLKDYNPAVITGNVKDRQTELNHFKNNKDCYCMLGTHGSLGMGETLNEADTVIFVDSTWTNALKEQCIDRCHRIGQTKPVTVITLITKDTIDEYIEKIIYKKSKLSSIIVDNEVQLSGLDKTEIKELFNDILSK